MLLLHTVFNFVFMRKWASRLQVKASEFLAVGKSKSSFPVSRAEGPGGGLGVFVPGGLSLWEWSQRGKDQGGIKEGLQGAWRGRDGIILPGGGPAGIKGMAGHGEHCPGAGWREEWLSMSRDSASWKLWKCLRGCACQPVCPLECAWSWPTPNPRRKKRIHGLWGFTRSGAGTIHMECIALSQGRLPTCK